MIIKHEFQLESRSNSHNNTLSLSPGVTIRLSQHIVTLTRRRGQTLSFPLGVLSDFDTTTSFLFGVSVRLSQHIVPLTRFRCETLTTHCHFYWAYPQTLTTHCQSHWALVSDSHNTLLLPPGVAARLSQHTVILKRRHCHILTTQSLLQYTLTRRHHKPLMTTHFHSHNTLSLSPGATVTLSQQRHGYCNYFAYIIMTAFDRSHQLSSSPTLA
jgi:hypothetical protein